MKRAPLWSKRTLYKWSPYVGGAVLALGVVSFLGVYFRNTADSPPPSKTVRGPVDRGLVEGKTVPISRDVQKVASQFIRTAVARRNLRLGWRLTHPELRGCVTFKEWLKGTSCVIPYPVDFRTPPPFRVDESYAKRAELEVVLTPRKGSGVTKPQLFFIGLKKVGKGQKARWLVYYWAPRSFPLVPRAPE